MHEDLPSVARATGDLIGTQRFSTDAFAPGDRVAAWRELYGNTIAKLNFDPGPEGSFTVEATVRTLPGIGIASLATFGLRFTKPRDLIDSDDLIVVLSENGRYAGRQLGREVTLGAGDAVIRLNSEVSSGEILGRLSIIRVPTEAIAHAVRDVRGAVQRRIPADSEVLQLLRPYLRCLNDCATPQAQRIAVQHLHDLVALALGATRDATQVARTRGLAAARLKAIKDDIARNIARDDFSIGAVALRHQVTPRYIQKLFDSEGVTFTEYVLAARLERAHRMLSDPGRANEKVASVAFEAGFGDASYFYRAFRRRYGVLPSDVRAQATRLN